MKERLTGAIIVVALLVLLVPELLTGPGSRQPAKPTGADGAQLRSYTIDLKDAANGQPPPPTTPATAVSEDPVGEATPEAESASPPVAEVSPPVDDVARAQGKPMGSGADVSAAAPDDPSAAAAKGAESAKSAEATKSAEAAKAAEAAKSGAAPSAEDERPRSAFGPNARPQPEPRASAGKSEVAKSGAAGSTDASKAAAAKAEAAKADAARAAAAKADAAKAEAARLAAAAKADAAKAEAARLAAAKSESAKAPTAASSKPEPAGIAGAAKADAAKAAGSKGWAVQLGVFGSRDNAERLAKQVKGSGFPVLVNETSGKDGKKLYWVRVGPERDPAAAAALNAKLKAAGHKDTRVVAYP